MGKRASTFWMIAIAAVVLLAVLILVNSETIFQEGNPLPVFGGIWQLMVNKEPYAEIRQEPPVYITRAGLHDELFADIEKKYGVTYRKDKTDNFRFEGNGKAIVVQVRRYSKYFQIWEIAQGP